MLLVKTHIKESTISGAGLGCFATEFIAKGTKIWEKYNTDDPIDEPCTYARFDIHAGEEILSNYNNFGLTEEDNNWMNEFENNLAFKK